MVGYFEACEEQLVKRKVDEGVGEGMEVSVLGKNGKVCTCSSSSWRRNGGNTQSTT